MVTALPSAKARALEHRLRQDRGATDAVHEAAVAWVLQDAGVQVEFEPLLDGVTPDVLCPFLSPPLICEVWSRGVPAAAAATSRKWLAMERVVNSIPTPWALVISGGGERLHPPSSDQLRGIACALRPWLSRPTTTLGSTMTTHGYSFLVVDRAAGESAHLLSPSGGGGVATSDTIINAVVRKVRRYRGLATTRSYALMVVVGGGHRSAVDLNLIRSALAGRDTVSLTLSPFEGGVVSESEHVMRSSEDPRRFSEVLSAVGHLVVTETGPRLTVFPHFGGARPVGVSAGRSIYVEAPFGR